MPKGLRNHSGPTSHDSDQQNSLNVYIDSIREIVSMLEGAGDFDLLYRRLSLICGDRKYSKALRILSSRGEEELFNKLYSYRGRIDAIWRSKAKLVPTQTPTVSRGLPVAIASENKPVELLSLPDEERIHRDLVSLFEEHLPWAGGEGFGESFLSMRNIFVGDAKTYPEYIARYEMFLKDYNAFVRYFCPWMNDVRYNP